MAAPDGKAAPKQAVCIRGRKTKTSGRPEALRQPGRQNRRRETTSFHDKSDHSFLDTPTTPSGKGKLAIWQAPNGWKGNDGKGCRAASAPPGTSIVKKKLENRIGIG